MTAVLERSETNKVCQMIVLLLCLEAFSGQWIQRDASQAEPMTSPSSMIIRTF